MIDGDANADGLSLVGLGNDIMYVPKDSADITLAASRAVARPRQPDPRAAVPELSAGADHAEEQLPGELDDAAERAGVQGVRDGQGHSVELITDVFNVLNLVDRRLGRAAATPRRFWGMSRDLSLVGYDQAKQRGVYNAPPIDRKVRDDRRHPMAHAARGALHLLRTRPADRHRYACRHGSFASHAR